MSLNATSSMWLCWVVWALILRQAGQRTQKNQWRAVIAAPIVGFVELCNPAKLTRD
jgi:predicted membrane protein